MELWHILLSLLSYDRKGIGLKRLGASVVALGVVTIPDERGIIV